MRGYRVRGGLSWIGGLNPRLLTVDPQTRRNYVGRTIDHVEIVGTGRRRLSDDALARGDFHIQKTMIIACVNNVSCMHCHSVSFRKASIINYSIGMHCLSAGIQKTMAIACGNNFICMHCLSVSLRKAIIINYIIGMHCLSIAIRKTGIIIGGKHLGGMRCISVSIRKTIIIIINHCTSVIVIVIYTNMRILILILQRREKVLRLRFYLWPSPFVFSLRRRFVIGPIAFVLRALVIAMKNGLPTREFFGPPNHIRVGTRSRGVSSHWRL